MRHKKSFNHLSRTAGHRKAMLANMASSLILHKRITTTTAKAKALRMYVEPLITKSKNDSTHSRRTVFSYLQDKDAVSELFREISPKIAERPGGYTRILKTGTRLGDSADMCIIELVDYNENLLAAKEETATKSTRRRRRGGKKKTEEAQSASAETTEVTADTKTDIEVPEAEAKEIAAESAPEAKEEVKEETKPEETEAKAEAETKEEVKTVEEKPKAEAEKKDEEANEGDKKSDSEEENKKE
jgi:large subunit ribosomal protein L17